MTLLAMSVISALPAFGAEEAAKITMEGNAAAITGVQTNLNYVWTLVAAALVFFMQAGFAMVESGFTRAKSAVNIMMKNLSPCIISVMILIAT